MQSYFRCWSNWWLCSDRQGTVVKDTTRGSLISKHDSRPHILVAGSESAVKDTSSPSDNNLATICISRPVTSADLRIINRTTDDLPESELRTPSTTATTPAIKHSKTSETMAPSPILLPPSWLTWPPQHDTVMPLVDSSSTLSTDLTADENNESQARSSIHNNNNAESTKVVLLSLQGSSKSANKISMKNNVVLRTKVREVGNGPFSTPTTLHNLRRCLKKHSPRSKIYMTLMVRCC